MTCDTVADTLKSAERAVAPEKVRKPGVDRVVHLKDPEVQQWVKQRHKLRVQYTSTPTSQVTRRRSLQRQRSQLVSQVKKRQKEVRRVRLSQVADYVEEHQKSRVVYECARVMMPRQVVTLTVLDSEARESTWTCYGVLQEAA